MNEKVVIIGGGIGGLSTAAYLGKKGFNVELYEKNERVGGRASLLEKDGFKFDMGPSWYLMPDIFERYFNHFGYEPSDFLDLVKLNPNYKIFFKDGDKVEIPEEPEKVKEIFEEYEDGAGEAFEKYLEKSRESYDVGMNNFVLKDRNRFRDYLSLDVALNARKLNLFKSMDSYVSDYFDNKKLQQIMQYSLVFLGGYPKNTPALYNLMSHVDFNMGVYYPRGGIYEIIKSMKDIAEEQGVEIHCNSEVQSIERRDGRVEVKFEDTLVETDYVVSNAGYGFTETKLITDKNLRQYSEDYWNKKTYAPSAFLMYLGLSKELTELDHHNLVLPLDWDEHFEQIFEEPDYPDNPAYYVCNPSETDVSVAPEGKSSIFILVPLAPELKDNKQVRDKFKEKILDDFGENIGIDLRDLIEFEETFSVNDFKTRYNGINGTALGLAHTLRQTSVFRPKKSSKKFKELFYTGADTNPGIGMPMCLISGEQTAEEVEKRANKE